MLARIAHELYWLGRNLARAEFTARAVDGVFRAELQSASETGPGVRFGWNGLLAMLGGSANGANGAEGGGGTTLTLRRDAAASWRLPGGAYQASQYVKQRTALIWGIAERAMLRDEAKRFL